MGLFDFLVKELYDKLVKKEILLFDLVLEFFNWIEFVEDKVGFFIILNKEVVFGVVEEFGDVGIDLNNMFFGFLIGIKDNIVIKNLCIIVVSKILENFDLIYDVIVVFKLKNV